MMSESFRYVYSFSCKLKNQTIKAENKDFCNRMISIRNYFSRPMKFEDNIFQ